MATAVRRAAREGLEESLRNVVTIASRQQVDVDVGPQVGSNRAKKFFHQSEGQIRRRGGVRTRIEDEVGTVAEVDHHAGESFIHGT